MDHSRRRWLLLGLLLDGCARRESATGAAPADTAAVQAMARDRGEVKPIFQMLIYPMLDDRTAASPGQAITDPRVWNHGHNEQGWKHYLPGTANGQIFWSQGFSEPNAGSDLAGVRTRAERNAQGWLLNGQKIWTTNAHHCHYMIALVRTSGQVGDRHQGLSQLIVDLKRPGLTVRPIRDMSGDSHFCEVFFDQVQLDAQALIGVEGQGWEQVTAELAYERSGPERLYSSLVLFDQWLDFVRQPGQANDAARQLAGRPHNSSVSNFTSLLVSTIGMGRGTPAGRFRFL